MQGVEGDEAVYLLEAHGLRGGGAAAEARGAEACGQSARTRNRGFRGFDSSIFFILRGEMPRSMDSFPDI